MKNRVCYSRWICLVFVAFLARSGHAQSSAPDNAQQQTSIEATSVSSPKEEGRSAPVSVIDEILNARNHIGFDQTLAELYTPDVLQTGSTREAASFTFLGSRLYANFSKSRSEFHLDYSFGYRRNNENGDLSSTTHAANVVWRHRIARNTSLNVADSFSRGPNDFASPISFFQAATPYVYTQEIFVSRQQVTRSSLTTDLIHRVSRRTSVGVFGSHEISRYESSDFGNSQIAQIGVRAEHQLNRWLFFESSFGTYLNWVDPKHRKSNIQRLRALGFRLNPRPWLNLSASGGIEYGSGQGQRRTAADVDGEISIASKRSQLSFNYHHGLTSIVGAGSIFAGHYGTATFTHRLLPRASLQIGSLYARMTSGGVLESASAFGGFEVALHRNLVASLQYNYISQHSRNLTFEAPPLSRYAAYAALHCFWPPFRAH
jgi:hypothetical protein